MTLRHVMLVGCFMAFLYPVALGELGVNYSYVLLPVASGLFSGKIRRPGDLMLFVMGVFVVVLVLACLYQARPAGETARRLISFGIFMTVFSYMFVRVDDRMLDAFKVGLIGISIFFCLLSMYVFFAAARTQTLGFDAKVLVGSQRYGFIYLMALWLVYLNGQPFRLSRALKYCILGVLTVGLLLTFSRASVVAFLATLLLFAASRCREWFRRPSARGVLNFTGSVLGAVALAVLVYYLLPITFTFFGVRLFDLLTSSDAVASHLSDPAQSEGTRVVLAAQVLRFVGHNPFTGAGFLGVWTLSGAPEGSAHNEYLDVLLRTGIPGFLAYVYLLGRVFRYLWRHERPLCWGFVAVLVYGLFHETFKESQGACLLAVLLGATAPGHPVRLPEAGPLPMRPPLVPLGGVLATDREGFVPDPGAA